MCSVPEAAKQFPGRITLPARNPPGLFVHLPRTWETSAVCHPHLGRLMAKGMDRVPAFGELVMSHLQFCHWPLRLEEVETLALPRGW